MKHLIYSILLLASFQSFSQIAIKNQSLIQPDKTVLIQHTDNKLQITGASTKLKLVSQNGNQITTLDSNLFKINPVTLRPDTLLVYAGKKMIFKKSFTIDTFPQLKIQLGNIQKDTASISEILANKVLRGVYPRSLYNSPITIFRFSTQFLNPFGSAVGETIKTSGNFLSKEQESFIKLLQPGSSIIFQEIVVAAGDSRLRELQPFSLVIK